MRFIYFGLFVMLFCFQSCDTKKEYENSLHITHGDFSNKKTLIGEIVNLSEELIFPENIDIVDSLIILNNMNSTYLLQIFNLNTGEKVNDLFSFGSGPDEFLRLHRIFSKDADVWITDLQKATVSKYKYYNLFQSDSSIVKADEVIKFEEHFKNLVVLPDGGFVTTIINPKHKRISFYDSNGRFLKTVGDFPVFGEEYTFYKNIEGYDCELVLGPDKKHVFIFYKQTDLIEKYNLNGDLEYRLHGPDCFFPEVKELTNGNNVHVSPIPDKSRDAYFLPVVVNDKIYVLYSGRYYNRKTTSYLINNILVFDTEGKPLKQYLLDKPIYRFSIDGKTNILYGLSDTPEFHIVKYDLRD